MQNTIKNVVIVGGTHGNETSGLMLISPKVQPSVANPYPRLNIQFELGNPDAQKANVRFTQDDLNRQFNLQNLQQEGTTYEAKRAFLLNNVYGPKNAPKTDLVIDVHNTTSNMGATLIMLEADEFHIGLARYVKKHMTEAIILVEDEKSRLEHPYLCTIGKRGVMVEVGPQPQGVCRADIYSLAYRMTRLILDYCEFANEASPAEIALLPSTHAYRLGDTVLFPLDQDNQRAAMIHPQLQDQDFVRLNAGDPVFKYLDNSVSLWQGKATYPHFINEAAYHKSNIAFATSDLITL